MFICSPGQEGARALAVLGVDNRKRGPAELLSLEKQQVVIPNSSPQRPGEGRVLWMQSLHWD